MLRIRRKVIDPQITYLLNLRGYELELRVLGFEFLEKTVIGVPGVVTRPVQVRMPEGWRRDGDRFYDAGDNLRAELSEKVFNGVETYRRFEIRQAAFVDAERVDIVLYIYDRQARRIVRWAQGSEPLAFRAKGERPGYVYHMVFPRMRDAYRELIAYLQSHGVEKAELTKVVSYWGQDFSWGGPVQTSLPDFNPADGTLIQSRSNLYPSAAYIVFPYRL